MIQDQNRSPNMQHLSAPPPPMHHHLKKRKLTSRDSLGGFGSGEMDMKLAMGMAVDLGLTGEDEGDELMTMTDDQMVRCFHQGKTSPDISSNRSRLTGI